MSFSNKYNFFPTCFTDAMSTSKGRLFVIVCVPNFHWTPSSRSTVEKHHYSQLTHKNIFRPSSALSDFKSILVSCPSLLDNLSASTLRIRREKAASCATCSNTACTNWSELLDSFVQVTDCPTSFSTTRAIPHSPNLCLPRLRPRPLGNVMSRLAPGCSELLLYSRRLSATLNKRKPGKVVSSKP